jgi:hypothetical protein
MRVPKFWVLPNGTGCETILKGKVLVKPLFKRKSPLKNLISSFGLIAKVSL